MTIGKATEQQVTEAITRFEEKIRQARLNGSAAEAGQVSDWLFGVEMALGMLGLNGLALKAVRAQQYTAP